LSQGPRGPSQCISKSRHAGFELCPFAPAASIPWLAPRAVRSEWQPSLINISHGIVKHEPPSLLVGSTGEFQRRLRRIHGLREKRIRSYLWVTERNKCWEARGQSLPLIVKVLQSTLIIFPTSGATQQVLFNISDDLLADILRFRKILVRPEALRLIEIADSRKERGAVIS